MPLPEPEEIARIITEEGRDGVERLERFDGPEDMDRLCRALREAEAPRVRTIVAQMLARRAAPDALPCLLTALDDPDPDVIAAAEDAIGNAGFDQAITAELRERLEGRLLELLEAPGSPRPVRTGAQYALGLLRARAAVPALIAGLEDEEPIVRWNSAEALSHIGDRSAVPALEARAAREEHPRVATFIGVALEELAAPPK
jgi:HEAT repeat protein